MGGGIDKPGPHGPVLGAEKGVTLFLIFWRIFFFLNSTEQ